MKVENGTFESIHRKWGCDDVAVMTIALILLGYVVAVLLVVVIIRLQLTLDKLEKKRVSYELLVAPEEVVDLVKRDPVKLYFEARPRAQA